MFYLEVVLFIPHRIFLARTGGPSIVGAVRPDGVEHPTGARSVQPRSQQRHDVVMPVTVDLR